MKPLNIVILASVIAVAGTWTKKKQIEQKMVVGGAFLAIAFAVLSEAQPKIASPFAWLILASTVGAFGEELFTSVGGIVTGATGATTSAIAGGQSGTRSQVNPFS